MSTDRPDEHPFTLAVGAATDVGRVREHNEDAFVAEGRLFVVADGMGGHAAGEVASGLVVDTLRLVAHDDQLTAQVLLDRLDAAQERILEAATSQPERRGMGTTATGVALVQTDDGLRWAVVNVGDSRVYRWGEGSLRQVTTDHSEVRELIDAGVITPDEARTHPARNIVTRSLGGGAPQADIVMLPVVPGERFVVCSDGLTGELEDDEIADLLGEHDVAQVAAEALVREAVVAGGRDNVTVVVVDVLGRIDTDS